MVKIHDCKEKIDNTDTISWINIRINITIVWIYIICKYIKKEIVKVWGWEITLTE